MSNSLKRTLTAATKECDTRPNSYLQYMNEIKYQMRGGKEVKRMEKVMGDSHQERWSRMRCIETKVLERERIKDSQDDLQNILNHIFR